MRSGSRTLTIVALAFTFIALSAQAGDDEDHAKYTVVPIDLPADPDCLPGFWRATTARRMNERGEVVGDDICVVATGDTTAPAVIGGSDAFRWHRALGATMLPALSANSRETYARDINESGTAIGWEDRGDFTFVAPVWPRAGGVSQAIEPEACDISFGAFSIGDGINDRGDLLVLDDKVDASGVCQTGVWVLKLASGAEVAGPISGRGFQLNNNRVAVGQSSNRAIRWSPTSGEVLLYDDPTFQSAAIAWSINDRDEAVGHINHFDPACISSQTATFWAANGEQTLLNPLHGDMHTWAYAINNHSEVVGYSFREPPGCDELDLTQLRAVIWEGRRAVNLNSLVPQRFTREFKLSIAAAINDRGQIVARGIRRGEPKMPCPRIDYDPVTGENFYNDSIVCQNVYAFLLTPKHPRP
jgi:uncharacterized membrane protein